MSKAWNTRLRILAVGGCIAFGIGACEQDSPTDAVAKGGIDVPQAMQPLAALGTTSYPATIRQGDVTVCKEAHSPSGTYNFTVTASPTVSGDQVTSSVALTPGTCSVVFERATVGGPVVQVTVTEVIPSGASYQLDHITAVDYNGTRNVAGPSVTVPLNGYHGASATFFNVTATAPPPPPPPPPGTGHIVVCKSANSPAGTFSFNVNAVNTITGDVVKSTTNLSAGSCDTVFVRVQAGQTAAAVTITESVAANASTFLQSVTVDGQATATVGAGVVVTQNLNADRVVVFVNASATVGASVAYHPTSQTPGVIHLCKSADSPPGTFNFTVNAVGTVATDQVVSNVSLTAGTCKVIFIRTVPQLVGATLTVTETLVLGSGIVLDRIAKVTSSGNLLVTGAAGIVVTENASPNGGALLLFFNKTILIG